MAGNSIEASVYQGTFGVMITTTATEQLVLDVIQEVIRCGATEFCICSGSRNAPFVQAILKIPQLKTYFWFEERSAAFFALGRSRETNMPVAVITTSGSAAGELLPAAMEAYYSGLPLLLITADRPASYRGTGAPQAAEQVNLYGVYATPALDISIGQPFSLSSWAQIGPAHLNVCIDEPLILPFEAIDLNFSRTYFPSTPSTGDLSSFFEDVHHPFVVVSTLASEDRPSTITFLEQLNAPVYLEGISGLRGHPRLRHLEICCPDHIWCRAAEAGYPIDAVLRIGGVPTFRSWRDLESMQGQLKVLSLNRVLFSGLSWGQIIRAPYPTPPRYQFPHKWQSMDQHWHSASPNSEPSMIHDLSRIIPQSSLVYLGNSLPIREWDLAACRSRHDLEVRASRGINGIDGQLSTFLGMCSPDRSNWGIFGDLTTLYDLAAPWILRSLTTTNITIVVINNGGGRIFADKFPILELQNEHALSFAPFAAMWNIAYSRWTSIPSAPPSTPHFIELAPAAGLTG